MYKHEGISEGSGPVLRDSPLEVIEHFLSEQTLIFMVLQLGMDFMTTSSPMLGF